MTSCNKRKGHAYSMLLRKCLKGRNPIHKTVVSGSGVTMHGNSDNLTEAYMDKAIAITFDIVGDDGVKGLPYTSYPTRRTMKTRIKFEKGVSTSLKDKVRERLNRM